MNKENLYTERNLYDEEELKGLSKEMTAMMIIGFVLFPLCLLVTRSILWGYSSYSFVYVGLTGLNCIESCWEELSKGERLIYLSGSIIFIVSGMSILSIRVLPVILQ